ncbi:MAG: hypothetical protein AAF909_12490 [Pseudomonadota bacterium]
MTLVSASIPNLVNGVSQQAYTQRLASQAEEQVNFLSSISDGLTRRPPSKHLARISSTPFNDATLHLINRDVSERYMVAISDGDLRVFDLNGVEQTVSFPNGKAYLAASGANTAFRAVTVADHTFIVNREQVTALTAATSPTRPAEALVNVRQGNYARTYTVKINGVERAKFQTPDGSSSSHGWNIATTHIASQLYTQILSHISSGALPGFSIGIYQNALHISKSSGDFAIEVQDGFSGFAMTVAKDRLQNFTDLPSQGPNGFQVEIIGDPATTFDNYYVRFEKSSGQDSAGVWRESLAGGAPYQINAATMPHVLVREADGTFTFRQAEWADREVGDLESAPQPSFIGRKLSDVFFFRNRLGFLADENVIMSRAGQFFNFWPKTVTAQVDSDPIDVAGSHNRVSILRHATAFDRTLLLFADQTQFVIDAGDVLTPATAAIRPTTEFVSSARAKPVGAGRHVFFVTEKGGYAGLREYAVEDRDVTDAAENTRHAASYIPEGVFSVAAAGHDDLLALLTEGAPNAIYLYKYYWSRDEKLQSSWSRWEFGASDRILACEFIDARMLLIIERSDGVYLETVDLDAAAADPGFTFQLAADRRITEAACAVAVSVQDGQTVTDLTLPYAEDAALWVVARADGAGLTAGQAVPHTRTASGAVRLLGDFSAAQLVIGRRYRSRYLFSPFILREAAPAGGAAALGDGRLQILYLALFYEDTGGFEVSVTPKARATYRYPFTGRLLGGPGAVIGATALESGRFKLPVYARNTEVAIEIQADGFLPARFVAAEWEGRWVLRSRRMS